MTIHSKMKKALVQILSDINSQFIKCTFSSPRKEEKEIKNITVYPNVRPEQYSIEIRYTKHNNIIKMNLEQLKDTIEKEYLIKFKQCLIQTSSAQTQILINKKGSSKILIKETISQTPIKNHKTKNYLIPDGKVDGKSCTFLIKIGVMDSNGKVKPNQYKKFRQINRFLEMVDDLFKDSQLQDINIVDFGCGKSYLTFALYYYFRDLKKIKPTITGIDLKQDVIDHCNSLAEELAYQNLKFIHGFIQNYHQKNKAHKQIDFVVTLHACDTATDDAIIFALENQAANMMFVPCCQHELNSQIQNAPSNILLKHGIFKERLTSLITDTMRAQLLEACGHKVQCLEFIESEHTAKNILLRCQKIEHNELRNKESFEKYLAFKSEWAIAPYLEKKLIEKNLL